MLYHENRSHLTLAMILLASCWGLSSASACWASLNNLRMAASPSEQQPNNASACGGQPFCVETSDFTATVTSFRTSLVGSSRILNVSVRFQNRTAQPLVLGYVANSGITTDERGNRYIVYGGSGFRGIGLVYGNTFDPRFTLRPAGSGDAQFEMHLQATPQNAGQTFTVDLTVDEINNSGGQPTLGGEFPLHFEGLANGVSQGVGSMAGAPDGLANAVSNLKSIFGKKKAVQNAASVANSAANTAATVNAAANSAASQPPSATANTLGQAGSQPSTSSPNGATASAPVSKNLPAADLSGQPTPNQQAPSQPQNQSRTAGSPTQTELRGAALADPSDPDPNLGTAKVAVSAGKYDVLGIKLGMPAKEAMAVLKAHGQYQTTPETIKYDFLPAPMTYGVLALNPVLARNNGGVKPDSEKIYLMLTMPPNQPVITKISRYLVFSKETAPTAESLVAGLVKKYGTPSYDSGLKDLYASPGYRDLFWVDDAQGHRLLNQAQAGGGYSEQINNCKSISTFSYGARNIADPAIEVDPVKVKQALEQGYTTQDPSRYGCANLTMIYANIFYGYPIGVAAHDVAGGLIVVMGTAPLDHTAADATRDYLVKAAKNRDLAQKQKAQQNKPVL